MINFLVSFFLLRFCCLNDVVAGFSGSLHPSSDSQCNNFIEGPFGFCSGAGYNQTFAFPEILTEPRVKNAAAKLERRLIRALNGCAENPLALTMACSLFVPHCGSKGQRVLPCKRVCSEFLKQCEKKLANFALEYTIPLCHVLPKDTGRSGKCYEPPKFTTNESIKGPLERNCSELIFPACKNLGVSNYTLVSLEHQKRFYKSAYRKEYKEGDLETDFPLRVRKVLEKYPKCQGNLKKLFCGEYLPPCFGNEFSSEGAGHYTICRSVCNQIYRDCPEYFRDDFPDTEYCSTLGNESSNHGFCRRKKWPTPFAWTRYFVAPTENPTVPPKPEPTRVKTWIIAVAAVVTFIIVAVGLGGAIWWKWRRVPSQPGYKKQEDDVAPLEQNMQI